MFYHCLSSLLRSLDSLVLSVLLIIIISVIYSTLYSIEDLFYFSFKKYQYFRLRRTMLYIERGKDEHDTPEESES